MKTKRIRWQDYTQSNCKLYILLKNIKSINSKRWQDKNYINPMGKMMLLKRWQTCILTTIASYDLMQPSLSHL